MAKRSKAGQGGVKTADYRHTREKRTNIPPAKIEAEGKVPQVPRVRYHYSPHLPPVLRFDPDGQSDTVPALIAEAGRRSLTTAEQKLLTDALRNRQPWLEWADKREQHERGFFDVDPVALHIHERVSTQAILRVLAREDVQRELFADPQQPYAQAVQFYKHPVDWANRLILGDSLQVMTSLANRENLANKVQAVYVDPPYGIKFASNFQPQLTQRDVKDRDSDLTREPEMIRAYRDTWTLGAHSYLTYLRERFMAARLLLADTGSLFVQIGDQNAHLVRSVLDDIFGIHNSVATITYKTSIGLGARYIDRVADHILWFAKDVDRVKYRSMYTVLRRGERGATRYNYAEVRDGSFSFVSGEEEIDAQRQADVRFFTDQGLRSRRAPTEAERFPFEFEGKAFRPGAGTWRTTEAGLRKLERAHRLIAAGTQLRFKKYFDDFGAVEITNFWDDVGGGIQSRSDPKIYVVQTATSIIERCLLMTTDPGDLVLDPTCGSGTTAYVAENWGRRWITCDTSRVALSLARQRIMTAKFPYYQLRPIAIEDEQRNPDGTWLTDPTGVVSGKVTFKCKTVPHITLKSIARNAPLDPIFAKHEPVLADQLSDLNMALKQVTPALRQKLATKLIEKQKREGKRAVTDADRRRWDLPKVEWRDWQVPFDVDSEWPKPLRDAFVAYRKTWRTMMDEVNAAISANAEMEELVDHPEEVKSVVRVSGPFTVEGVRPEELSLGEDGLFDPTADELEEGGALTGPEEQNLQAYFSKMIQHLRSDGVSFMDNTVRRFGRLEALFDSTSGSVLHAEGSWDGEGEDRRIAVTFGPESGPVTALQVEEAIREARQYDELVIAGFSFDAEVTAVVAEQSHPRLRIHQAFIRPDLNSAMDGLLKDTPRSQLFTVFGQPDVEVNETKDGWICTLGGVSIYDPLENMVRSTGAEKVAAWFLDSDFDGRCFCITQAFFPDQNAWEKIAKALGAGADLRAFEKLKGTTSLTFQKGKFGRVAVKVIDPRGNEVMAIRKLE